MLVLYSLSILQSNVYSLQRSKFMDLTFFQIEHYKNRIPSPPIAQASSKENYR